MKFETVRELAEAAGLGGLQLRSAVVCAECGDALSVSVGLEHEGGAVEWGELVSQNGALDVAWRAGRFQPAHLLELLNSGIVTWCDDCWSDALGSSVVELLKAGLREGVGS